MSTYDLKVADHIMQGAVAVIPTDTIYGLVASAWDMGAVQRVYEIKGRDYDKRCIILIADPLELVDFGVSNEDRKRAQHYWPASISVDLRVARSTKNRHLLGDHHSLAFRVPADNQLRGFLKISGPLIAPSANPQGQSPATSIEEAKTYFGSKVDLYLDGGKRDSLPSKLISLITDEPQIIRQ